MGIIAATTYIGAIAIKTALFKKPAITINSAGLAITSRMKLKAGLFISWGEIVDISYSETLESSSLAAHDTAFDYNEALAITFKPLTADKARSVMPELFSLNVHGGELAGLLRAAWQRQKKKRKQTLKPPAISSGAGVMRRLSQTI